MHTTKKTVQQYEAEAERIGGCLIHPAGPSRQVYQLRHGLINNSTLAVCHTCDNPLCIEDSHHFLGTWKDNVDDAVQKGRHSCFKNVKLALEAAHKLEVLQDPERCRKIGEASRKRWITDREKMLDAIRRGAESRKISGMDLIAAARSAETRKATGSTHKATLKGWETRRKNIAAKGGSK